MTKLSELSKYRAEAAASVEEVCVAGNLEEDGRVR